MTFRNHAVVVPSALFSTPLPTRVLHVSVAHQNRGQQNLHFFRHKCRVQELLPCTTAVHMYIRLRSALQMGTHFTGNNKKGPWRLSLPDKETSVRRLCLRDAPTGSGKEVPWRLSLPGNEIFVRRLCLRDAPRQQ